MSIFALLGWISILLLIEPVKQESIVSQEEDVSKALTESDNSSPKDDNTENEQELQGSLKSTINLFFTIKMMKINGLIIISGGIVAFFGGLLVKMISNTVEGSNDDKLTKSLYCMIVFSCGEFISGYGIGKLIDYTSRKFGVFLIFIITTLTIIMTIYTHSRDQYDAFWFVSAFLWGLSDSTCCTVISSICGSEFLSEDGKQGSIEPFAIFKFTQSFIICILIIAESFFKDPDQTTIQRWYLIGMGIFTVLASIWALTFPFKRKIKDALTLK